MNTFYETPCLTIYIFYLRVGGEDSGFLKPILKLFGANKKWLSNKIETY